jgi:hypothetical protein
MPGVWTGQPASSNGHLYRFDGTSWSSVTAVGTLANPISIWGTGSVNVWLGLADGTLKHLTQ